MRKIIWKWAKHKAKPLPYDVWYKELYIQSRKALVPYKKTVHFPYWIGLYTLRNPPCFITLLHIGIDMSNGKLGRKWTHAKKKQVISGETIFGDWVVIDDLSFQELTSNPFIKAKRINFPHRWVIFFFFQNVLQNAFCV